MVWPTKSNKIYLELVISWLRTEIERLSGVLATIERTQNYHEDYIFESIKSTEVAIRQIRKFIDAN